KLEFARRCETNLNSFVLTADDRHARCGHRGGKAEPFENLRSECNGKSHTRSDHRNDSTRDDWRNGTGGRKNEQRTVRRDQPRQQYTDRLLEAMIAIRGVAQAPRSKIRGHAAGPRMRAE